MSVDTEKQAGSVDEAAPLTDTFVQEVPDKCDRIIWRGRCYHLHESQSPAALAQSTQGVEVRPYLLRMLERGKHRTDGDLKILLDRTEHMVRGDQDCIAAQRMLLNDLHAERARVPERNEQAWVERDCEACDGAGGAGRLYGGPSHLPSVECEKCKGRGKIARAMLAAAPRPKDAGEVGHGEDVTCGIGVARFQAQFDDGDDE